MSKFDRRLIRKMILEEAKLMKEERIIAENNLRVARLCAETEARLLAEGYSRREVNEEILTRLDEGFFSTLLGLGKDTAFGAPGGFLEQIEQMFIEKILKSFVGGFDPDSLMGAVLANTLENIDITEIAKYFGTGACDPIVETIYRGFVEALGQKGLDPIFGDNSKNGWMMRTLRESFVNAINDTQLASQIKEELKTLICSTNYGEMFGALKDKFMGMVGGGAAASTSSTPSTTSTSGASPEPDDFSVI